MRQRSEGTWELTVSAGRDASTGSYRRVIRTVHASTKRDAKAALSELEVEVRSGRVGPEDVTLAELLERWMEHLQSKGRSQNTLYGYRCYIDREILPTLGATRLSKLTTLNVDRFYDSLVDRGLAAGTVRQAHAILRASLNQAEKWGLVGRNVAKLASPPAQPQREQHPPSVDQVRRLLETASETDPTFAAYVRLVAATGMRRAEACAVRWGDLDLEGGTLEVSRSHVAVPGFRDDQSTKTRSTRTVSIDEATVAMLVAIKSSRPEPLDEANHYVFTNDGYRPWRPDYASTRWAQLREQAGVDKTIRLHDLRHWQATRLLDAGVPLPTVAARLGHASGATTMKVYAHRTPEADQRASEIVGDMLDGT
ncbi:MAG: integrase [Verrucomicrobiales bacterium]|jgi:integrase